MKNVAPILLASVAPLLWSCGLELSAPPLELSTRDSLVGAGKIVRIANISNEEITAVEIEITSPEGESRSFSQATLNAYETLEIGWKKLGGWQIVPGSEVTVRAAGFLLPYSGRLEEAEDGAAAGTG